MDRAKFIFASFFLVLSVVAPLLPKQAKALMPYSPRSFWETMMIPQEDPFRILEQNPLTLPKGVETLALARADWKETEKEHLITLDIPGIKKDEVKIEIEDNRGLRISGERKTEEEVEGDKWHRAERNVGKFWRQFRLPVNANLDKVQAHLENGVIKIVVPKLSEEKIKKQPKVISIAEEAGEKGNSSVDVKATKKDEM